MKKIDELSASIKSFIDSITGTGNNLVSDFNLQEFYSFLDSLTLIQELSFIHLLVFIFLLLNILSVMSIFFGNEIIRYFDLEARFPRLSIYFKLRNTFQRYYLLWNIFLLVLVVIIGILMILLAFF